MTVCLAESGLPAGTPVLTPSGEVPVESLVPGMLVIAVSGVAAPFQRVQALLRRQVRTGLVRIQAGALADASPLTDLRLPPGHGVFIDGRLFAAGSLALGPGIAPEAAGPCDLFDLVLAGHDAVLAAGIAVETAVPDAQPFFCPRAEPDGVLRAMLAFRAEAMGWVPPVPPKDPVPEVGSLRARLAASPFTPPLPRGPLLDGSD